MATSFPRQFARTNRFTLGAPRAFSIAPDGSRLAFLRSRSGTDRAHLLWVRELGAGPEAREYVAADPEQLLGGASEELSPEERARRERSREGAAGVVGYAVDGAVELAAFALSGRLFTASLTGGGTRELAAPGPVVDPRPSPDGQHLAYVCEGALRVVGVDGAGDRALRSPEAPSVTYGLAEFIAAEEMDRSRGFWWSPGGGSLLVARADDAPVGRWWIADPAHPDRAPSKVAYPAAGTANAEVTLHLVPLEEGAEGLEVRWDRAAFPYLARVHWSAGGPPLLQVQSRDQRESRILRVDPATGETAQLHAVSDPVWVELFGGVPVWSPGGRLVRVEDRPGARVLLADGTELTDGSLFVRDVLSAGEHDVLFTASLAAGGDPGDPRGAEAGPSRLGDVGVYRVRYDGSARPERLTTPDTRPEAAQYASAVRAGDTVVLSTAALDRPGSRVELLELPVDAAPTPLGTVASYAEQPPLSPAPLLRTAGRRRIPAAVLRPTGYDAADGPLPVLMDPYGGPHGQRVVAAQNAYLTSQWFADQGFAVVIADGRGTPGHSPEWEKSVHGRLAEVTLADQVDAVQALAEEHPLDLSRVAVRGWSYGGYLAALAVLRRPDVFHAAVVGAPVTDWRLYDTHYTERYLGTPQDEPAAYAASSLVTDDGLADAADTHRPMMVIHGLADDNVAVAHSLRLSSALLAAGRPHEVLPLSGVTHMTPQEQVAENLLLLQVDFLRRSLKLG